jgi:hypothetical protein
MMSYKLIAIVIAIYIVCGLIVQLHVVKFRSRAESSMRI